MILSNLILNYDMAGSDACDCSFDLINGNNIGILAAKGARLALEEPELPFARRGKAPGAGPPVTPRVLNVTASTRRTFRVAAGDDPT
jgi:hypothetical protein